MPYAAVKDKVDEISPQYREELLAFLDFLIFRQKQETISEGAVSSHVTTGAPRRHAGGITGEFYMAPDFDEHRQDADLHDNSRTGSFVP